MKISRFPLLLILALPLVFNYCKSKKEEPKAPELLTDLSGNWDYTDSTIQYYSYSKDTTLNSNFNGHSTWILTQVPNNINEYTFTGGGHPLTDGKVIIHINPINDSVDFYFLPNIFLNPNFADPVYKAFLNRTKKTIIGIREYTNGWYDKVERKYYTSTTKGKFILTKI